MENEAMAGCTRFRVYFYVPALAIRSRRLKLQSWDEKKKVLGDGHNPPLASLELQHTKPNIPCLKSLGPKITLVRGAFSLSSKGVEGG
jgi:hypothetical protein